MSASPVIWDGSVDVSWYQESAQAYNLITAEQLAGLAHLVNEGHSDFLGKTITLGADIFLNDTAGAVAGTWASIPRREWIPIGNSSRPFRGKFDGIAGKKNRKIYGLYINDTTKTSVGLFGYTSGVQISNLEVLVGRVTAKDTVGALIGYAEGGSVSNVHSEIKVTGRNYVGGLIGNFSGSLYRSSVKESVVGKTYVGGLMGYASGSVSDSHSEGSVTGRGDYIGGLVGYGSSVTSSYHVGGDVSGASYVGGLMGYASGSVSASHSEGSITGTGDSIGGLVGRGYSVTIDSSYHVGGEVSGRNYVGGLVGYGRSTHVKNSYSEGSVTGTRDYIGGLVGLGYSVTSSYHVGDVGGSNLVGGLIGYASGTVKTSHSEGSVIGIYQVVVLLVELME